MILFKGKKARMGPVHMDITTEHLRKVFFPKEFHEIYSYLGAVPYEYKNFSNNDAFHAIKPLVIYLDYLAKPWWCPRWFLRLLHLFGNDNSLVRVRSFRLHYLFLKLTKGYAISDYKTKWTHYDLRISIRGNEHAWWLAEAIETKFYTEGRNRELMRILKELSPSRAEVCKGFTNDMLVQEIKLLEKNQV